MSMSLGEFDKRLTELLITEELRPFLNQDPLDNGLQVRGRDTVERVGFAVSSSMRVFEMARGKNCDALVVHHGLFIQSKRLEALTYRRLSFMIQNQISLWSAHFVGDAHPVLGNNAQILKQLGIQKHEPYTDFSNAPWGRIGRFDNPVPMQQILDTLNPQLSPQTIVYDFDQSDVQTVVSVSGKGAPAEMESLMDAGVDLYITGEVHEWHREYARESGVAIIGGGHYHTETFGVQAIQREVEAWDIDTVWIDLPNDV